MGASASTVAPEGAPASPAAAPPPRLLLAGLPGPVRDTLESFGAAALDPRVTRFLSPAAAIAFLGERDAEADEWDDVTRGGCDTPGRPRARDA